MNLVEHPRITLNNPAFFYINMTSFFFNDWREIKMIMKDDEEIKYIINKIRNNQNKVGDNEEIKSKNKRGS